MLINKLKLLKTALVLGALYYLIGAFVHFFGLTLFPFYDANLYSPYHDSLIALSSLTATLFLLAIARDPVKNKDTLVIAIIVTALASIFSFAIIWKVDFLALGAPAKKIQTLTESGIGFCFVALLIWLFPRKNT